MNGATNRQRPFARRVTNTDTSKVTTAITGPALTDASAGRSCTLSNAIGRTLTAINMVTVPETTGVTIRRSAGSHHASAIWIRLQITSKLAKVSGPPAETADTMIAMNIAAGQVSTIWPAPNR